MDSEDAYQVTIDYIKKIENEINFSLNDTHLNDFHPSNENINSLCDILLEKVKKEIVWTTDFEEKNLSCYTSNTSISQLERSPKIAVNDNNKTLTLSQHSIHDQNNQNVTFHIESKESKEQNKQDETMWTNKKNFTNEDDNSSVSNYNKNSTLELDKESNYRYSFYDNFTKFSIYLADSMLIDQVCAEFDSNDTSNTINSFSKLQIQNDGQILPDYIENALIYLSKAGLSSVGIFRKSGVKSRINILKDKIQQNEPINFESSCVYDVADVVKTWLRDLKPHLLTTELIEMFSKKDKDNFHLWHLDDCHRYLLFVILRFLSMVSSYSQKNQMTIQNLAICFAPSLCEGENEKQINRAQKCLQYCIENYESLFYLNLKDKFNPKNLKLNCHTSVLIINASPHDILSRLLYERNVIDKLISKWTINQQSKDSDIFEFNLQFSWLLPTKTFSLKREWGEAKIQEGLELKENGDMIQSYWIMVPNGKGQTLVKHDISLELRGMSGKWYKTTFASIHDQQLKRLALSFEFPLSNVNATISEV